MNDSECFEIPLPAAFRLGCLTGLLSAGVPAFLCSIASHRLVHSLHNWVSGWSGPDAELTIGGLLGGTSVKMSLDLQKHLNVTNFMQTLKTLDNGWWWMIPLLTIVLTVLGGIALATLASVGSRTYNWLSHKDTFSQKMRQSANRSGHSLMAWLSLTTAPHRRWRVSQGLTRVGSNPSSEITLPGELDRHAEIRYEQGRYVLYDLSNGRTWVQDRPVTARHLLKSGFQVRFGNTEMIFHKQAD